MIIKTDHTTTSLHISTQDALELIRQLADAVATVTARERPHNFCMGACVASVGEIFPAVLNVVVSETEAR